MIHQPDQDRDHWKDYVSLQFWVYKSLPEDVDQNVDT